MPHDGPRMVWVSSMTRTPLRGGVMLIATAALGEPGVDILDQRQPRRLAQHAMRHAGADQERFLVRQRIGLEEPADGGSVMAPADRFDLAVEGTVQDRQEVRLFG